jgi:hypothetical protein
MNNTKLVDRKFKLTKDIMIACLNSKESKPKKWFIPGRKIKVNNRMQKNYEYILTFKAGVKLKHGGLDENNKKIIYPDFNPAFTPKQMLKMGVFEGKYCNDQIFEFPREWFDIKKLSPESADQSLNYFKVKSRQSLQEWLRKKWIPCTKNDKDSRGWFEWYCRYYLGRRMPDVDKIQIKRWRSFNRHYAQYLKHTKNKGIDKHPKRRQALLQWSYPCIE